MVTALLAWTAMVKIARDSTCSSLTLVPWARSDGVKKTASTTQLAMSDKDNAYLQTRSLHALLQCPWLVAIRLRANSEAVAVGCEAAVVEA